MASTGVGNLRCPKCGEECDIAVRLADCDTFDCPECNDEFSLDNIQEMISAGVRWATVLDWLKSAPRPK